MKMNEIVTLELPEAITKQARALAAATRRHYKEVLTGWIENSAPNFLPNYCLTSR